MPGTAGSRLAIAFAIDEAADRTTGLVTRGWPAPRTPDERFRRAGHVRPFGAGRVLRHELERPRRVDLALALRDKRSSASRTARLRPRQQPRNCPKDAPRCLLLRGCGSPGLASCLGDPPPNAPGSIDLTTSNELSPQHRSAGWVFVDGEAAWHGTGRRVSGFLEGLGASGRCEWSGGPGWVDCRVECGRAACVSFA
jgi:hypothetical protein